MRFLVTAIPLVAQFFVFAQKKTDNRLHYHKRTLHEIVIPDNYPVTNEMFGYDVKSNGREIKSGNIRSLDKVWFRNDTLKQILVFELYTDNFRNIIFHFKNDDIPKDLIKIMELADENGEPADDKSKQKVFSGFVKSSRQIDKKYFRSDKGFKLDDSKSKALQIYGKPDKISKRDSIEKYEWKFVGDPRFDPKKDKTKKPFAQDSFGYQVTMFFRNNKLIAIIIHNDIP